ncbi:alanine dehydrogenase [Rhodococcoides trifolii]|uniref:Alanine dehydrogenase n=1 Tax=Rhodococcoides trifolii TaxID=908250 RepID=A0A917CV48_9NOCA|nr:N(5)-(carboxyethyl)ornithine synthase [Rhodococcus trifolii]GGG00726.1 alanine dehydrogenase [Rhodococcus trifolii]
MTPGLTLGVLAHSRKTDERRLPLHPAHLRRIDPSIVGNVFLERGYGERFGISDADLEPLVCGIRSRAELIEQCDVVLLPKPLASDLAEMRDGQVVWGWPHCVQDAEITQLAIDKRLTLIAFEVMNHWKSDGSFGLHVFHKNNELAGYCSVLQGLEIIGSTGDYGRRLTAVVIGFGATARGAVTALNAHGIDDVRVLTHRGVAAVGSPIHGAQIVSFLPDSDDPSKSQALTDDGPVALAPYLAESDIVVNCVLQDTDSPLTFLTEDDLEAFAPGSLIVDVSCDEGMGFSWARPTSFTDPSFVVGNNIVYYAVDHTPSFLWNSATWEISEAILPHLSTVLQGPEAWSANMTIDRAIEIRRGVITNPSILRFQNRVPDYPHRVRAGRRPVGSVRSSPDVAPARELHPGLSAGSSN